ncbi:MAG: cardiolipin synthase [Aerococcus sp.]|nr:cardiolipin synthase [Aerococcus sp.]
MASFISLFIAVNTILAIITVFRQERPISTIWAWLLVLIMLPGVGFILYFFFGRRISNRRIFQLNEQEAMWMTDLIDTYVDRNGNQCAISHYSPDQQQLMTLLYRSNFSILTEKNDYQLYHDGKEKMAALIEDLKQAKHHINIQYYIFTPDEVGQAILDVLTERAQAGVHVRLLYDAIGSRKLSRRALKPLREAGGEAISFFGYLHWIQSLRANFRNHRKIVVIDGKVAYIGGFNVAKEYIGKGPLGYWRDTHMRVIGEAVQALQSRFIVDWCASAHIHYENFLQEFEGDRTLDYFPENEVTTHTPMQMVSSGPEDDTDQIKMGYLKMISMAKKSITLQTPYFIPDESAFETLQRAALSGVDVKVMVPCKPDHPFVYRATEYYCKQALECGIKVYRYDNGFLHAKVLTIDDGITSLGTANFDVRSFRLNFEMNAFVYDAAFTRQIKEQFERDLQHTTIMDKTYFKKQSRFLRFRQLGSRLFSPLL